MDYRVVARTTIHYLVKEVTPLIANQLNLEAKPAPDVSVHDLGRRGRRIVSYWFGLVTRMYLFHVRTATGVNGSMKSSPHFWNGSKGAAFVLVPWATPTLA